MVDHDKVKCLRGPCLQQRRLESNLSYLKRLCKSFLDIVYGTTKGELWYSKIKRRCIFEESFPEASGVHFKDYKVWMINGRVAFVGIDHNRFQNHKRDYVTPAWRRLNIHEPKGYAFKTTTLESKPPFWDRMLQDARKLSKRIGSPHSRIDFFGFKDDYAFSEVTYAHDSCWESKYKIGLVPKAADLYYGDLLKYNKTFDPEDIHHILNKT